MLIFNYSKQKEAFPFHPAHTCKFDSEQIHFWRGKQIWLFLSLENTYISFIKCQCPLNLQADQTQTWVLSSRRPPRSSAHHAPLFLLLKGKVIQVSFTFSILKNFFQVLFWHRHIHIPTSQARALLWWRSSAPSRWSASTRPWRASSSSTSPLRWSVCQSLIIILFFSTSEVYRQVHHLDLHGQEVLQRIRLERSLSQIITDWPHLRLASGGSSVRSLLTSKPLAPRWGWEVLVWTLLIGQVVGVCTDSHVTVRTLLMNSAELKVFHGFICHWGSCW